MSQIKTACVQMTGNRLEMDVRGKDSIPVNRLPIKCPHCTMPDLDAVPEPYLLVKGFDLPTETVLIRHGNFLVRQRVRHILEVAVPEACTFHPTADAKSKKPLDWWVAAPTKKLKTFCPESETPHCSKCGAPKAWWVHRGELWAKMTKFDSDGVDLFKTLDWEGSTLEQWVENVNGDRKSEGLKPLPWSRWAEWAAEPPTHSERWTRMGLERELYFSVRLEQLFKRAKVKGILRLGLAGFEQIKPSVEDEAWIEEKMKLLAEHGLVGAPKVSKTKSNSAAQKWFKQFLQKNAKKVTGGVDFSVVEGKYELTLPQDYKDFISQVGSKSFLDVNGMEGATTEVLAPNKLDFKNYRRGKIPHLEGEDAEVDGVVFAEMDSGDCFLFDVAVKGGDYPVYFHNHEENSLEPFASSFAECLQRFAKGN